MRNQKITLRFLQQDLDRIIEEAWSAALAHVKEKLAQSFEDVLWEEALSQIECLEDPAGALLFAGEDQGKNTFDTSQKETPGNNKRIYLYGITEVDADDTIFKISFEGMSDGEKVLTLVHKDLMAVICEVPETEFSEAKIQELTENRDWLEDKAERHQRVISALMGKYAVIPMRFCTLYQSQDQLRVFLEENQNDLVKLLQYLQNKTEWGLKLYLNEELFKRFLQDKDESINNLMNEMSLHQTGKGYLPKKRLANRIEQKAFDLAEEVHRRLCRFSAGAVLNKLPPKEITGREDRMILNGAYLLEKNKEENFFETVKWLEETEGPRGFIFEISGPWPCYNFCQMSSTGT